MRRIVLDPPRAILGQIWPPSPAECAGGWRAAEGGPSGSGPTRDRLRGPAPAHARRRRLFHPKRGWLRRLERRLSHVLARDVFPQLPGTHLPYDFQLRRGLTLSEADIDVTGLPRGFDGVTLLFVSDVHAGPFVSPAVLRRTFEHLLAVRPDAVLLGGDLVSARVCEFDSHREAFEALRAPLGVHAVLGNHDHYAREPERMRAAVEASGITVLHNRSIRLSRGGDKLTLAGVDDMLLGESDLDAALAGARRPVVLLSHNPDLFFEAERRGVALMLSGHTHGGQIRIPRWPVLVRQSRYRLDEGRFRAGGTELVVSRGLGAVALPWRLHCSPEALLLRLRRVGQ